MKSDGEYIAFGLGVFEIVCALKTGYAPDYAGDLAESWVEAQNAYRDGLVVGAALVVITDFPLEAFSHFFNVAEEKIAALEQVTTLELLAINPIGEA